jgi:hypothetical protein
VNYLIATGTSQGKEKKTLANKSGEFLIFNTIISENKKTPKDLEIPPPRYFRDMRHIEERDNLLDACLI